MNKKLTRTSLVVNIVLVALALFFTGKRWRFRHQLHVAHEQYTYKDNPEYWEQLNLQDAYNRQANIVLLGDSHIYKAQWEDLLNRTDVAARGIGNDLTAGYVARIDQVLKAHPKIVFIEGGANDLYYDRPVDSIVANLRLLLNELDAEHITVVFHTLPPFAAFAAGADEYNSKLEDLNQAIVDLCKTTGTPYIDLYRLFEARGYLRPEYAQMDGYHLTGEAYKIWAGEIQKKLQEVGSQLAGN